MIIHTLGASGSGTTTTGKALAERLDIPCYDGDDYFWLTDTPTPYSVKRDPEERDTMLLQDMAKQDSCVVAGSMPTWSNRISEQFDVIAFLELPDKVRMDRLQKREMERYGEELKNPETALISQKFLAWAQSLSQPHCSSSRSHEYHQRWMAMSGTPVLRLGDLTVEERVAKIVAFCDETGIMESSRNSH